MALAKRPCRWTSWYLAGMGSIRDSCSVMLSEVSASSVNERDEEIKEEEEEDKTDTSQP